MNRRQADTQPVKNRVCSLAVFRVKIVGIAIVLAK